MSVAISVICVISVILNFVLLAYASACRSLMLEAKEEVDKHIEYIDSLGDDLDK